MAIPNRQLARIAIDNRLNAVRALGAALSPPRSGWIRAIRTALGMTLEQLASRLQLDRSSVLKLEASERGRRMQLDTLSRVAEALDCELHYVLMPRVPLEQRVRERRSALARARLERTVHTMALENQYDANDPLTQQLLRDAEAAIPDRALWKAPE